MRPALFRPEIVAFQRDQRQWGEVALLQPPSAKAATWVIAAFAALVVVFLCLAPYARKETVSGYLAPAAGTARIYAPQPGIVSGVHVEEGQEVREGDPLLSVATAQVAADGQDVNAAMLDALWRQADLLARQLPTEEARMRSAATAGSCARAKRCSLSWLRRAASCWPSASRFCFCSSSASSRRRKSRSET